MGFPCHSIYNLHGGFQNFLIFTPIPGEMIQFDVRIVGSNLPPYVTHRQGRGAPHLVEITDFLGTLRNVEKILRLRRPWRLEKRTPSGQNGVCHRDLKPENFLLMKKAPIKGRSMDLGPKKKTGEKNGRKEKTGGFWFIGRAQKKGNSWNSLMWSKMMPRGIIYRSIICICIYTHIISFISHQKWTGFVHIHQQRFHWNQLVLVAAASD